MNEREGINKQLKNPVTRIFSLWKMGSSVVVLLFRDLPKFCPRPVSRSILNPFACHWALWATEGEQQLREGKRKMQKSFSLASPVVPLCNPATVQSDLKEREGVGIHLRGALQWGANFVRIPLGLWLFIQNPNGSKGVLVDRDAFVKNFIKVFHFSSPQVYLSPFHIIGHLHFKNWMLPLKVTDFHCDGLKILVSLFYCLCLWYDQKIPKKDPSSTSKSSSPIYPRPSQYSGGSEPYTDVMHNTTPACPTDTKTASSSIIGAPSSKKEQNWPQAIGWPQGQT